RQAVEEVHSLVGPGTVLRVDDWLVSLRDGLLCRFENLRQPTRLDVALQVDGFVRHRCARQRRSALLAEDFASESEGVADGLDTSARLRVLRDHGDVRRYSVEIAMEGDPLAALNQLLAQLHQFLRRVAAGVGVGTILDDAELSRPFEEPAFRPHAEFVHVPDFDGSMKWGR